MKLTLALTVMCTAIAAVPAAPQSPAPTGQKLTLANTMIQFYAAIQRDLLEAAELMPDADYAFKPTPETRPFGQLIAHAALSQFGFCSFLQGGPSPKAARTSRRPERRVGSAGEGDQEGLPGAKVVSAQKMKDVRELYWQSVIRPGDLVSLLGWKPLPSDRRSKGDSEFKYYPFRSENESGAKPSLQDWLDSEAPGVFRVHEFQTLDYQPPPEYIPRTTLDAINACVAKLLEADATVVLMDSGGETRTGYVRSSMGYTGLVSQVTKRCV